MAHHTRDQRIHRKLALLARITEDLINLGESKEEAEAQAGEMVIHSVRYFTPMAVAAVDDGIPETQFLSSVQYPDLHKGARKAYRTVKRRLK